MGSGMTMYEINKAFRQLADDLEEAGGEFTPELLERAAKLEGDLTAKAKAYVAVIDEKRRSAEARAATANRLFKLATAEKNTADRIERYLLETLIEQGVEKLDVEIAKLAVRDSSTPSIEWKGDGPIPVEFQKPPEPPQKDGAKLLEAYRIRAKFMKLDEKQKEALRAIGKEPPPLPTGFQVKIAKWLSIR